MRKNKITDRSAIIRPVELCRFSVFFLFVRGIRISYSVRRNTALNLLLYIIFIISENFIDAKLRNGTLNWNFFSKRTMDNCDELLSFLPIDSWFNLFFLLRTEFPFTPTFVVWNRFSGWAKQRRINVIVEEEQCVYTNRVCRETETKRERERGRQYPRDYFLSPKLRDPTSCGFPLSQGTNKAGHIPEIS